MAKWRLGPPGADSRKCIAPHGSVKFRPHEVVAIRSRPWPYHGVVQIARVLGLVTVLGLTAAACSNGASSRRTASPPTTSTTAATTTTTTVEEAVIAGYQAFWAAYLKAADPMNPQHADLAATSVNPELDQVRGAFLSRLAGHEVIRGSIEPHPHIDGPPTATSATLTDCATDNAHIFDASTGQQKDSPETVTHLQRVQMSLVDGVWKVERISQLSNGCTP